MSATHNKTGQKPESAETLTQLGNVRIVSLEEEIRILSTTRPMECALDYTLGVRCFREATEKSIFFAILLAEFDDSFLIALPASFISDEETITAEATSKATILRKMKSDINCIYLPEPDLLYYYIKYISSAPGRIPEFFTGERSVVINGLMSKSLDDKEVLSKYKAASATNVAPPPQEGQYDEEDEHEGLEFKGVKYNPKTKTRH